jgi:hypothetical protein
MRIDRLSWQKPDFIFEDTPGWKYFVEEVSLSTYRVTAIDEQGRKVEFTGHNEEQLVSQVHQEVLTFVQSP